MNLSRFQDRPDGQAETASPEAEAYRKAVDYTRAKLGSRCTRLEGPLPEALDLGARCLTALRLNLKGRAVEYRGDHSPQMWGDILRGDDRLDAEDLYRLSFEAPAAVVEFCRPLLAQCGQSVDPIDAQPRRGLAAEATDVAVVAAEQARAVADAEADGVYDAEEIARLMETDARLAHEQAEVRKKLAEILSRLTEQTNWRAKVAGKVAAHQARAAAARSGGAS